MRNPSALLAGFVTCASMIAQSVPCFETSFGANIGAGDDTVSFNNALGFTFPGPSGPVTAIDISSNGFVWLGTNPLNGSECCSGNAAGFTAGNPRVAAVWMDLYPPGAPAGGGVFFNAIPAGGGLPARAVITWYQCPEYFTNPNVTAQIQLVSTGEILIHHDATNVAPQSYHSELVGVTQGAGAIANVVDFGSLAAPVSTGANPTAYQVFTIPPPYNLAGTTTWFLPNGTGGYVISEVCVPATHTPYGTGCINRAASFYENFATSASFDLANSAITMIPAAGGYTVVPGITTYVAPSASATVLALTDDSETTVALTTPMPVTGGTTSALTVCSNGFVSVATGNGTSFSPAVAAMLAAPQTGWWAWHDFNPSIVGSGQVKFEEIAGVAYVTWDGVWDYGGSSAANASTQQLQFDTTSGMVHFVFGNMSVLGNGRLIGYSPGGPSIDPGNLDISVTLPATFSVSAADVLALALAAAPRPVIGTTVTYTTTNVPTGTILTGQLLSFGQIFPGIDLGFLGAPGCLQLINSAGSSSVLLFGGPTVTFNLLIPNNPAFAGVVLYGQSASLTPGVNPLGLVTSNGIRSLLNLF